MRPGSSVVPVVASGTASVAKLLVATLAFVGAYMGVETSHDARAPVSGVSEAPVQTVILSSQSMPVITEEPWRRAGEGSPLRARDR